jgi:hypothetical protein
MVPDTARLAEKPRVCLQESVDEIPTDYTKLFNQHLFSINTGCVPAAIQAYQDLNVKHELLRLITPQFETPLPPLQAAVIIYYLTHFTIIMVKAVALPLFLEKTRVFNRVYMLVCYFLFEMDMFQKILQPKFRKHFFCFLSKLRIQLNLFFLNSLLSKQL